MEHFAPGDRVVAIDTALNGPRVLPNHFESEGKFRFPDGALEPNKVYHVQACCDTGHGSQGLYLTGLRVFLGKTEISWSATRFRRVESSGHPKVSQASDQYPSN